MIAKVHDTENGIIVVVCDSDLIGKKFEENDKQLDLASGFYDGEEMDELEIADLMRNAHIVHLVGEKAVNLGVKEEVVDKKNITYVQGIPHAESILND